MMHLLATLNSEVGDLSHIARFVKVTVFVKLGPDFAEQHLVANGATDLLVRAFGDQVGRPARLSLTRASRSASSTFVARCAHSDPAHSTSRSVRG